VESDVVETDGMENGGAENDGTENDGVENSGVENDGMENSGTRWGKAEKHESKLSCRKSALLRSSSCAKTRKGMVIKYGEEWTRA
jgi:hypothetical protein